MLNKLIKQIVICSLAVGIILSQAKVPIFATCQSKTCNCGSYGTLTVNVWRQTDSTASGNTLQWDYQVSAQYSGKKKVNEIRTSWYCSADMRKSATLTLSVGPDSVSASASSSWQTKKTGTHYWSNTNGTTASSYRSDVCIGPKKNYEEGSICTYNTGFVHLKDSKAKLTYSYTASV